MDVHGDSSERMATRRLLLMPRCGSRRSLDSGEQSRWGSACPGVEGFVATTGTTPQPHRIGNRGTHAGDSAGQRRRTTNSRCTAMAVSVCSIGIDPRKKVAGGGKGHGDSLLSPGVQVRGAGKGHP
jgi:hypothetical protein